MPPLPAIELPKPRITMNDRMLIRAGLAEGDSPAIIATRYFNQHDDVSHEHRRYLLSRISRIASEDREEIAGIREQLAAQIADRAPLANKTVRILKLNNMAAMVEQEIARRIGASLESDDAVLDHSLKKADRLTARSVRDLMETYRGLVSQVREECENLPPRSDGGTNVFIEQIQALTIGPEQAELIAHLAARRIEGNGDEEK